LTWAKYGKAGAAAGYAPASTLIACRSPPPRPSRSARGDAWRATS